MGADSGTGCLFSYVLIAFMNRLFPVLILTVVTGSYARIPEYVRVSWARTRVAYAVAYQAISNLQIPDLGHLFSRGS